MHKKWLLFYLLSLILGLAACGGEPALPTSIPVAEVPTSEPTVATTPLPPSPTPIPVTSTPTVTAPPAVTVATPTAAPVPSDSVSALINLTSPSSGVAVPVGGSISVSGLSQTDFGQTIWVRLVSAAGDTLIDKQATLHSNTTWQIDLPVPVNVIGAAQIQASVRDAAGNPLALEAIPVTIVLDTEASPDRYLALYRPLVGTEVVGGYYLFFDGLVQILGGTEITIALYADCVTEAAATSFFVRGSGYWQGYLFLPGDFSGSACAIASIGQPGEESWRAAQIPITLYEPNEEAYAVYIYGPAADSELVAGQGSVFWGMAYNAADDIVQLQFLREDGVVLGQSAAAVGDFGYWETEVLLPLDAYAPRNDEESSILQIIALIGNAEDENQAQNQLLVNVLPPLTPTPEQ